MSGASHPVSHHPPADAGLQQPPASERRRAPARKLLPIHRLTVIAKTPLLVSIGLYVSGGHFTWPTVGATLALSSLMWGALYAVNEAFDLTLEQQYIVPRQTIAALVASVAVICLVAFLVSHKLALLFILMTLGQLAYCMPPFRLKRWWWPVLLLSGIVNPVLRTYCGAIWGPNPVPILALVSIVMIHLGSTIRTRALQRDRDRKLNYRISPRGLDRLGAAFTAIGLLVGGYLCVIDVLPRLFLVPAPLIAGFTIYAWSDRAKSMKKVRRGWILFVVVAIFGLVLLLRGQ